MNRAEVLWERLEEACHGFQQAIMGSKASSRPSSCPAYDDLELYCAELKSVTAVNNHQAFRRYEALMTSFARDYLEPQLANVTSCDYLAALVGCWQHYAVYSKPVVELMQQLYYSDRYGYEAKQIFLKRFLHSERFFQELRRVLLEHQLLESSEANHHIVSTLALLADIGYNAEMYVRYFETPLLAKCMEDSIFDANNRIQATSVSAYLAYVDSLFHRYTTSALFDSTKTKILHILQHSYVYGVREAMQEKLEAEWNSHFDSANGTTALSLLLCNIQKRSTPSVAQAFCRLFRISVQKKVSDVVILLQGKMLGSAETLNIVTSLIAAYRYCHGLLDNVPSSEGGLRAAFQQGVTEALRVDWNLPTEEQKGRGRLVEEYLASFGHRLLSRQSAKVFAHDRIDEIVAGLADLYFHCANKDIFVQLYQRHLTKRLLLEGSYVTEDRELLMLSRLKDATIRSTGDLSGLHRCDMAVREVFQSTELTTLFKASPFAHGLSEDINAKVISSFLFPYQLKPVSLPQEFLHFQERFTNFYRDFTHKAKKLFWVPALSSAMLSASFTKGRKELRVSMHQASVLLLFNDSPELTVNEIRRITRMDEEETEFLIKQLTRLKVLTIDGPRDGVPSSGDPVLRVNDNFTNKRFSINLNAAQLKLAKGESEKARESALQSRRYTVRSLKARRVISHNELVAETMAQLKFPFETSWLKRVFEALISNGYMARTTRKDQFAYEYLP